MNVLELLNKEINNTDWTLEDKAFYLFLRSCQLFTYDPRYNFYLNVFRDKSMLNKIENHIVDLENVDNNFVVCYSHSKVFSGLLYNLLELDTKEKGKGHSWVEFNDGIRDIEADSTIYSDLSRVKMGLNTYGYLPIHKEYGFEDKLKNIAIKVNYIDKEYNNGLIMNKVNNLYDEFLNYIVPNESSTFEYNMYKLYSIKEMFDSFDKLSGFSDKEFCIRYLLNKLSLNESKISLFDNSDINNWKFINIYLFDFIDEKIYFILDDKYFYQICEYDALNYINNMDGINKELIYKR